MSSLSKTPQTFWVVLLGTLGFLAGINLIQFQADDNLCSASFSKTLQFSVWYCLVGFETAVWSIFSIPLWQRLQQFESHLQKHWIEILLTILLITLLSNLLLVSAGNLQVPLNGFKWKTDFLNAVGFIIILMAGSGMWLVQIALKASVFREHHSGGQKISNFLDLRDALQNFLFTAGTIIGAATLATGALRQANLTWYSANSSAFTASCKGTGGSNFPAESVLLYGMYLSAILALAYLPPYRTLVAVGHKLCDELAPMPDFHAAEWDSWITKRKALEEILKLNLSVKQSFETGVAIFTPLLASSISLLLGKA